MNKIVNLNALSEEDYYQILKKSEDSPLSKYIYLVQFHGDDVEISDETIKTIAKEAFNSKLGVRSIDQILRTMFTEALFNAPLQQEMTHLIEKKLYEGAL
jgi:ATP-dependent HslUV protease ATP-binding subunit HslU